MYFNIFLYSQSRMQDFGPLMTVRYSKFLLRSHASEYRRCFPPTIFLVSPIFHISPFFKNI